MGLELAHRVAWVLAFGPIPNDTPFVCHHCDNPPCVNPEHLWVGTDADNKRDMVSKDRQPSGDRSGARLHPERVARGEFSGTSRLTENQVREIRRRLAGGEMKKVLAAEFNVWQPCISKIRLRQRWGHVT